MLELTQNIHAFAHISEIYDLQNDFQPNFFHKICEQGIFLVRIIGINEQNVKYSVSLRESVVNQRMWNVIQKGSSLQFQNMFGERERNGDIRNKIFKL